jgi:hypothetical protein
MTNVQLTPGHPPTTAQGNNFQQLFGVNYSADRSTQQGTAPLTGVSLELLNPSTGLPAFIDVNSSSNDALKAAATDGWFRGLRGCPESRGTWVTIHREL